MVRLLLRGDVRSLIPGNVSTHPDRSGAFRISERCFGILLVACRVRELSHSPPTQDHKQVRGSEQTRYQAST